MVTLKGSLIIYLSPLRREERRVYFFCFPLRGRKTKTTTLRQHHNFIRIYAFNCHAMVFEYHQNVDHFFFSALLRPVECGAYSSGVSRKENIFFLCELCGSSPASSGTGGEKHVFTCPHSKAGTTSQTGDLRD